MKEDLQHLKWLSIAHYFLAGFIVLGSCFGFLVMTSPAGWRGTPVVPLSDVLLLVVSLVTVIGCSLTVPIVVAGRNLGQHQSWLYCVIIACLD
ncbi:MAG TPA: hypothetical protein PLA90_15255, partial [Candidatus Sumerlaeota bacterium]|nr:hypothetical protein [Candidatus Sumerlaeota bacterium]